MIASKHDNAQQSDPLEYGAVPWLAICYLYRLRQLAVCDACSTTVVDCKYRSGHPHLRSQTLIDAWCCQPFWGASGRGYRAAK
jgi:hypothetical protein